jgi:hypothetical protein
MQLRRFVPSRTSLRTFAVAGAWFFIVVSLGHVLWATGHKWSEPASTYKLYHAIVGDHSYDAWGLTYAGIPGLITVTAQLLVITAAAAATVLPWPRRLRYRRIAHGILVGWAALWALDLSWLASVDHQLDTTAQAVLLYVLAGCTGYRALMGWSPGRSAKPPDVRTCDGDGSLGEPEPQGNGSPLDSPQLKAFVSATRHRTAAGLDRVGDFAHRQARPAMSAPPVTLPRVLYRAAAVCAWFFALATLATLIFVAWAHWPGEGSEGYIMFGGLGLTYPGVAGTVLIVIEAVVLAAAIALSVVPRRRVRLIGHALLVAWVGLWLGNAVNNARLDPGFLKVMLVPLLALFCLCTVVRAVHGFRTGTSPHKAAKADVAA